ncbi:MAG: ABC transporter permease [Candidatus Heimdallarchaeota archaeon]
MSIADLGYRKYVGEIKGRWYRTWTLAWDQFRSFWQGMWIKLLLVAYWLPIVIVVTVFSLIPFDMLFIGGTGVEQLTMFEDFFVSLMTVLIMGVTFGVSWVFFSFIGSGTIADDEKNRTLELYFTRAIHRTDYILGKAIALLIAAFLMELPPITVLFASFATRSPKGISIHGLGILPLYFGTAGFIFLANMLYIAMILAFSASTKSRRYAGISFFLFILFSEAIAAIITAFGGQRFAVLSVSNNLSGILNAIMASEGFFGLFEIQSARSNLLMNFTIIGGLIVLFSAILTYQVFNKKI